MPEEAYGEKKKKRAEKINMCERAHLPWRAEVKVINGD